MATKIKKKAPDILDQPVVKGDITRVVEQVQTNPVLYGAVGGFLLLCIIAGFGYRMIARQSSRTALTQFARAVDSEDASLRVSQLEPLAKTPGGTGAEASYLLGESAYEAKAYDRAKEAFEKLRNEAPDSPYVPDAVEGLGYIAENTGQFDQALANYKEIAEKWPTSFAARRQPVNIGRVDESLGKFDEAKAAYEKEAEAFPGSTCEKEAKSALERLKKAHPELFPKPAEEPKPEAAPGAPATEAKPATAPAAPAPAPEPKSEGAPAVAPAEVKPEAPAATATPENKPEPAPAEKTEPQQ